MSDFNDFKVWRTKAVDDPTPDDPDYATLQQLPSELVEVVRPSTARGDAPVRVKVEIVLEWLDASNDIVSGERGSYDMQVVRVVARRTPGSGDIVVDTPPLRAQVGFRPVVLDDILVGDRLGLRLTGVTPAAGATQARILYREII